MRARARIREGFRTATVRKPSQIGSATNPGASVVGAIARHCKGSTRRIRLIKSTNGTWANKAIATSSRPRPSRKVNPVTPRALHELRQRSWLTLQQEAFQTNAFLVPLRIFIGIGWLRAALEKIVEPSWHNGEALQAFIGGTTRIRTFPAFETFLDGVIGPGAALVAWLVIGLQLYCGAGILLGRATNAALLTGIGLNLTFIFAGVPNPSAFYILIQLVLFVAGVGAILGFDGRASAPDRSLMIAAPALQRASNPNDRWWLGATSALLFLISVYAVTHGTDFSPSGSVDDPALVLGTVAALGGLTFLITVIRLNTQIELDRLRLGTPSIHSRLVQSN